MRKDRMRWRTALVAPALALLAGGTAGAAALPVEVALELGVAFNGSTVLPGQETVATAAGVAQLNGSAPPSGPLTQLALPADLVAATGFTSVVTDPLRLPELGRRLTVGHGAGAFAAGPGGFGGVMALDGLLRLCLFAACGSGPPGNLSIPLSVLGVGGTALHGGALNVTVTGGPWTTGMVPLRHAAPPLTR